MRKMFQVEKAMDMGRTSNQPVNSTQAEFKLDGA